MDSLKNLEKHLQHFFEHHRLGVGFSSFLSPFWKCLNLAEDNAPSPGALDPAKGD